MTQFAQLAAPLKNVYAEIGTTFAACAITFPTLCAHMLGQLMKYMGPERIIFGSDAVWYGAPQWQIQAFWRFQIPEDMAKKYGYPRLTANDKRRILGINSANLYKLPVDGRISAESPYKPVPKDYMRRVPDRLKTILEFPGFAKPGADRGAYEDRFIVPQDKLAALRSDYIEAGGLPSNTRYGWVRR